MSEPQDWHPRNTTRCACQTKSKNRGFDGRLSLHFTCMTSPHDPEAACEILQWSQSRSIPLYLVFPLILLFTIVIALFFLFSICLWQWCLCSRSECQRNSLLLPSSVSGAASCLSRRSLSLSTDSGSALPGSPAASSAQHGGRPASC